MASGPRSVNLMRATREARAANQTTTDSRTGRSDLGVFARLGHLAQSLGLTRHDDDGAKPPTPGLAPPSQSQPAAPMPSSPGRVAIPLDRVPYEVSAPMRMRIVDAPEEAPRASSSGGRLDRIRSNRTQDSIERSCFCIPTTKSRRVRSQIASCVVSGIVFIVVLGVYVGLSVSNSIRQSELTIVVILIILAAGIFFCFCLIRLWLFVNRPERIDGRRALVPDLAHQYLVPPKPIPVVLAQDEEAVGIRGEAATSKPPAYGRWMETVRVDPNRLFWQRNEESTEEAEPDAGPRPPSYASENGVDYVLEAQPRSVAPPSTAVYRNERSSVSRSR
ncbi:hypothetical protein L249_0577 [Ophiocordyceps polyrhachis-furcata BCC 54312]|uniref:Uncharacterized protein n=1 Tax=Ophiocordyceps polyrhachis-furcata BCC 54312 TaxID=1330021 RepID=A0A367LCI6_9HYPO|nr:hypothetical protein L249_0577 [Ophiocordyceps polyrhachis-furcata BCC 54312]